MSNMESGRSTSTSDLSDPQNVPADFKNQGSDWVATFNPQGEQDENLRKAMDVNLQHSLDHDSVVCSIRFSADGKYLATGSNHSANIYDVETGKKLCVLTDSEASKEEHNYIRGVCFSPDGKYLATAAEDKRIRLWDIATQLVHGVYDGHEKDIYTIDYSKDGRLLVSGSGDKTVRVWDLTDSGGHRTLSTGTHGDVDSGVTSVHVSPDSKLVAAGCLDKAIRIWDLHTGELVECLEGHVESVYSAAFTPDGHGLISGSLDKTLKYWDLQPLLLRLQGEGAIGVVCLRNYIGSKDFVLGIAVSHDGQMVVGGSKDRAARFWNVQSGAVQCHVEGHTNSVIAVDLSPVGEFLATGGGDHKARIWRYNTL